MNSAQAGFLFIGTAARKLPRIRGKVALANYYYRYINGPRHEPFVVQSPLYAEHLMFQLNLNCAHERMAYLMGHYEEETVSLLVELWDGGTFLDVGANIGLISIPFAARIRNGKNDDIPLVYAVEALPSNFQALRTNITLNRLDKVIASLNVGLGATEADVLIQIEGDDPTRTGTANILPNELDFLRIPLTVRPIDALVEEHRLPDNISLIKIDTDGYDYEVLKGAHRLLEEQRPVVFAELAEHCLNWHGYGMREVVSYLAGIGYEAWPMISASPPVFTTQIGIDYQMNCLLIPVERRAELARYVMRIHETRTGR